MHIYIYIYIYISKQYYYYNDILLFVATEYTGCFMNRGITSQGVILQLKV